MALSGYDLPPYRPDAETGADMLLCMTAGTPLTIDQFKRIFRQKREIPNLVMIMTGIAYAILFTWMIAYSVDDRMALTGALMYGIAVIGIVLQVLGYCRRHNRKRYVVARCKGDVTESVTEIYTDRAVKTSERGQTVIRFSEADALYEWADMLCLRRGNHIIVWRSTDLTAPQVALIRKLVYARIDPSRRCFFERLQAWCEMTRPLPNIVTPAPQVPMFYQPPAKKPVKVCFENVKRAIWLLVFTALPPALVVATSWEITGIHLIDIVLFWAGMAAFAAVMMWLLMLLTYHPFEQQIPALLTVTDSGVAIVRRDMTVFFLRGDIEWRYTEHGIWITVPNETFWIHLKDISDPAMLQAILPPRRTMK